MAVAQTPAPLLDARVRSGWRTGIVVIASLAGLGLALRLSNASAVGALQNFLLVFGSLLVEALPFVVLGAAVSALIEVFVPSSFFVRMAGLPRGVQMPVAGLGGFAFPVCECGSVPVARRLVVKGLTPAAAVTFMLAAPILNPVVLISTFIAYRGRDIMVPMVVGRAVLGLVVAMVVGWIVANKSRAELLRAAPHDHDAEHDHEAVEGRGARFFSQMAGDFSMLAKYLVIGGAVASALQTFVPQDVIGRVAGMPIVDIVGMMVLAAMLSLCSESDAFVAASFVQFGFAAQLGFLVAGPMVDMKLGALYAGTFSKGFVRTVVASVFAVTLLGSLWLQVMLG